MNNLSNGQALFCLACIYGLMICGEALFTKSVQFGYALGLYLFF